jgi:acyl-CoA reductase-like NAD-dependent aldehyde dehydrogenase
MEAVNIQPRIAERSTSFSVADPATGEKLSEYPLFGPAEVDKAIAEAREAFPKWARIPFSQRERIFYRAASLLAEKADHVARVISSETGKTRLDALLAEIFPTCDLLRFYGRKAERFLRPVRVAGSPVLPGRKAYYTFEPRGVVAVIAPWNYPFTLASGPVLSALAAGNSVVLKPSSQTTASGEILKEILVAAGLPPQALQIVTGSGSVTGKALIENPGLDMIVFTGSTSVGIEVSQAAAKNLIPTVLELGGKDAMIVTAKADLDRAAHAAVWGAFFNSGQTCTGVEFCFVEKGCYERFLAKVLEITRQLRSGTAPGLIGSMTMESQLRTVEEQIADAVAKGAIVHTGGKRRSNSKGLFFEPTVLTGIRPDMKIWQEETFGPVLPIVPYETAEQALAMANSTSYGLSGSVFSLDLDEARWFASRMITGSVNINDCLVTFAFPSLPFGGVKKSGLSSYHGKEGLRNFCRVKAVTEFKGLYAREFFHYPVAAQAEANLKGLLRLLYGQGLRSRVRGFPAVWRIASGVVRQAISRRRAANPQSAA